MSPRFTLGVISDVHADLRALDRALHLLVDRGVDKIVCLGDVLEKGPDGDAVVARLDDWLIPTIAGNHEDNAARHAALTGDTDLSPATLDRVQQYPRRLEYCWEGVRVCVAHGTPEHNTVYVFPDAAPRCLKRELRVPRWDVVLLGHTHRPMRVQRQGVWLLNPGSVCVGRPRDSHTCGVLSLPDLGWTVLDIATGAAVAVGDAERRAP